ncbi:MAG: DUF547 domain-containing protein [Cyanobacteria bacterium P01_A01_bin.123]
MRQSSSLLALLPVIALMTGCVASVNSQNQAIQTESQSEVAAIPETYDDYAEVLETYVDDQGLIDYAQLQANRQQLDSFVASFAAVTPSDFETWTEAEQIAYWVNAYNAITLQSIVNQEPLKGSIKDILGVWRITTHSVLDQSKTLDDIEHNTLRANHNEPRIHAALVCAAISCPPLRAEPFRGDDLDAQLEDQSQKFIDSPMGLQIDRDNNQVMLSMIFNWFGQDWIPTYGVDEGFTGNDAERAVLNFITNYVSEEDAAYLREGNYEVKYLDYDWALNIQS